MRRRFCGCRAILRVLARPMVALVGARSASSLGLRMARRLGEGLGAAGLVVVSGLARGIDAEAHQAALDTGTVAVQAGGVDHIYPAENARLAAEILAKGCRGFGTADGDGAADAAFPDAQPNHLGACRRRWWWLRRRSRSGSLITAEAALEQGREVFAVPGHPFDARAAGCNRLIRDGATLVRSAQDILEALRIADSRWPPWLPEAGGRGAAPDAASDVTTLHNHDSVAVGAKPGGRGSADPRSGCSGRP